VIVTPAAIAPNPMEVLALRKSLRLKLSLILNSSLYLIKVLEIKVFFNLKTS
jgi:hypothetical protein